MIIHFLGVLPAQKNIFFQDFHKYNKIFLNLRAIFIHKVATIHTNEVLAQDEYGSIRE